MLILYILAVVSLIMEYGFYLQSHFVDILRLFDITVVFLFIAQQLVKLILAPDRRSHFHERNVEYYFSGFFLVATGFIMIARQSSAETFLAIRPATLFALYIILAQFVILIDIVSSAIRYSRKIASLRIQPARIFIASFVLVILLGSLAFSLPKATTQGISYIDALFTSASAVCVTGLIVVDTPAAFSPFGKIILLVLIQIGGLGLMTFTTFFTLFSSKLSIKESVLMQEFLNKESIGEIRKTLVQIVGMTLIIEMIGAVLLYFSWGDHVFGAERQKIFSSVFHSVSAFCNAGFSMFSANIADPRVATNVPVNLIISGLIIIGGIGFLVVVNLLSLKLFRKEQRTFRHRLTVHSRLVLITTLILIVAGSALVYFLEHQNTMRQLTEGQKILAAFFQSVTARTAGFNTIDIAAVSVPTCLVLMLLMFIGASPGSTGGGIKTTTISLLYLSAFNMVRGKQKVEIYNRQIMPTAIDRAYATLTFTVFLLFTSVFLLSIFEAGNILDIVFECVSAAGTVGLSRGITGTLADGSKVVLVFTMLIGRVGAVTMAMALAKKAVTANYDYPSETIVV